jgi:hypothetical protein
LHVFDLRSLDLRAGLGLLHLHYSSHFPLQYVTQHRSLTAIGQKKASSHLLVFTGDTRNGDREKSSGHTHLSIFGQWSHGQNLRLTPGQAEPIAPYFGHCLYSSVDAGGKGGGGQVTSGTISAKTTCVGLHIHLYSLWSEGKKVVEISLVTFFVQRGAGCCGVKKTQKTIQKSTRPKGDLLNIHRHFTHLIGWVQQISVFIHYIYVWL